MSVSRTRSFLIVAAAYLAALVAAFLVAHALGPDAHPLVAIACADAAATLAVFAFSTATNNSSVYDPYWSVAPIVIASYLATLSSTALLARKIVVVALVTLWGVRLTYNWARGFRGLVHEDWRYVDIREKTGRAYWPASLAGIHLFPTVQVYLGCLPLYPALTSDRSLGVLDAVAFMVTSGSIVIETVADEQLRRFRAIRRDGDIMAHGLWAYSRHPNYFGEVGFWGGLYLFALAADPRSFWTGAGFVAIALMFVFVSIPMLDKRSCERRPEYAEHVKRVSPLIPWWPKKGFIADRARPRDTNAPD